jgi:hypothetical protein
MASDYFSAKAAKDLNKKIKDHENKATKDSQDYAIRVMNRFAKGLPTPKNKKKFDYDPKSQSPEFLLNFLTDLAMGMCETGLDLT